MTSYEQKNILEPLDPLNISFSEDKCVKTPETLNSDKKTLPQFPRILVKDPSQLFGLQRSEAKAILQRNLSCAKGLSSYNNRYNEVYKTPSRMPSMGMESWNRRYSNYKQRETMKNIGMVGCGEHFKEIRRLDSLINRVNRQLESGRKFCP